MSQDAITGDIVIDGGGFKTKVKVSFCINQAVVPFKDVHMIIGSERPLSGVVTGID